MDKMTEQMAIKQIKYRVDTASKMVGNGVHGKGFSDLEMAIQALEEIQQYRAIENELKEKYHANVDIKMLMQHFIETIFKGEKHEGFCILTNEDAKEWEQLKALGTVEELKALKEKSVAKKVIEEKFGCFAKSKDGKEDCLIVYQCPTCGETKLIRGYPCKCGQKLDWE